MKLYESVRASLKREGRESFRPSLLLVEEYRRLIRLTRPEVVPYSEREVVMANRRLIRHASDVPVLLSAVEAKPDWLLTHNTKHFTQAVARRTGLRIAAPVEFFETLSALFR